MLSLSDIISKNRTGQSIGIPCFCTANAHVIKACLAYATNKNVPIVIEATCNQVNQDGGYTGMTPQDFMEWVNTLADDCGLDKNMLIMGGDHLGPNPWRYLPIDEAMEKARVMVQLYVEAGFTKIHLDASMACGGEPNPSFDQIAERAADLCAVAERYAPNPEKLFYIIGTEVPIPGGETEEPDALDVTSVDRFLATIDSHRRAWANHGLDHAWNRIFGVVTQPGVDFGHTSIYPYDAEKTVGLRQAILDQPNIVFEAHSTDYQTTQALSDLVQGHFMFLKVGPELTFRFREAVFALAKLHAETTQTQNDDFIAFIDDIMVRHPEHWQAYYSGTASDQKMLRKYSYSDRIRYYWTNPDVAERLEGLLTSDALGTLPETLVSQYFMGLDFGDIPTTPAELIEGHITKCIARYYRASGMA